MLPGDKNDKLLSASIEGSGKDLVLHIVTEKLQGGPADGAKERKTLSTDPFAGPGLLDRA